MSLINQPLSGKHPGLYTTAKEAKALRNPPNSDTIKTRKGCKDIWNAYMAKGAIYTPNDIPFCPTTATDVPHSIITWDEAKAIYKRSLSVKNDFQHASFVCFYIDDYKFDGPRGIWHDAEHALTVLRHFAGVITPDFSTYQDFPEPLKIYATYRMRLMGYWLGTKGVAVINNVRWGTDESYRYCFDGIPKNSVVCIGTVGGSPRKHIDRNRFENGLYEMVRALQPHTILVYGSASYKCFDELRTQGINILAFPSQTSIAFERRKSHE